MATTPQAERLRRDVRALTALAANDLRVAWARFDTADAARDGLLDLLPRLIELYGAAAATLAADWYDDVRDELGAPRRFRAIPAALPADAAGAAELARWGIAPLFQAEPDVTAAQSLVDGGLQRRIVNASRETITASAIEDPAADGWQRVGSGDCAFCSMLLGRGAVYSEKTADFAAHDHCHCSAVPAFGGQPRPVKPYKPSLRQSTEADRALVREYLATH